MTAPDGSRPPGALGVGLFTAWSTQTVDRAKGEMRGGVVGSFNNAGAQLDNNVKAPIQGQAGSITNHETRIVALEDGGIMTVYSGNDTWVNQGGRIGVAVINGGQAGQNGVNSASQRLGGNHGGYQYREFDATTLPATVAITVGAPGTTEAQAGGVSSFGSYLVGVMGSTGAILTGRGALASNSAPGAGGNNNGQNAGPGFSGASTALATGGSGGAEGSTAANPGGNGGNGGNVDTSSITPCGGAGGGAGGGGWGLGNHGGNGGNGGAPGGGGGAGGNGDSVSSPGSHGDGGAGRVFVIQSAGG